MIVTDPEYSPEQIADILQRRAQELAQPLAEETSGHLLQLLVFQLQGERYGIDMLQVLEIYPMQPITPVPRAPDFVIGIFSARGRFLSIVSLPALLGHPLDRAAALSPHSQIIAVHINDMEIAFLADAIEGVWSVHEQELQPSLAAAFTRGIAPGMTAVLDLPALFDQRRLIVDEA